MRIILPALGRKATIVSSPFCLFYRQKQANNPSTINRKLNVEMLRSKTCAQRCPCYG
jgi:hypothetical protein